MKKLLLGSALLLAANLLAQAPETPAEKNRRMAWWREAKFGLFIHWGAYAVAAGEYKGQKNYGEWLMYEAKIPRPEYEQLAGQFNPVQFDADAWVRLAKNAGMKYIVITSKHHDGFCLFDSKVSDYDIADRTAFRRDPLRELADACRKHGLKLCFYHSIMDWHHPDANKEHWARYRDEYLKPQLRELLTRYGDIGVLWFDGEWIDEWTEAQGKDLYRFVRGLQPSLIVNNRVGKGRNGMQGMNNADDAAGDFGTPEQEILGESSGLDWESCMTMNDHWGYNRHDKNFKSAGELIWNLADIVAKGGNYLLNVGPTAEGTFPPECVERLDTLGAWTRTNAAALYGAQRWTHWQEGEHVRYVQGKNKAVFAFVRGLPTQELTLKKIQMRPGARLRLLGYAGDLRWTQTPDGLRITLPPAGQRPFAGRPDWTWVFQLNGAPADVAAPPRISGDAGRNKKPTVFSGATEVRLEAEPGAAIFYTTDGSEPNPQSTPYAGPFTLKESATVKAIARSAGKMSSETAVFPFAKAAHGVRLETEYAEKYAASGPLSLVDGVHGSTRFTDGNWLGFEGNDVSAVLDLGEKRWIGAVGASFLRVIPSWIFLPTRLEVWVSDDGAHFVQIAETAVPEATADDPNAVMPYRVPASAHCRYVRVVAKNQGLCPAWHPGAGAKSWVFVDEVWVDSAGAPDANLPLQVFQARWTNAKAYTLEVAEAMPEEHYGFKPMDEEMSFGEQIWHMAGNIYGLTARYVCDPPRASPLDGQKAAGRSKKEITDTLAAAFDYAAARVAELQPAQSADTVNFFAGPKNRLTILNLLNDHQAHHRGQAVVYLRLKGIKPPRYIGW